MFSGALIYLNIIYSYFHHIAAQLSCDRDCHRSAKPNIYLLSAP